MRHLAATLLLALAAPAVAIPPALPPQDQFQFSVDGVNITCRLPELGGPLTGCIMQDSVYLLAITVQRLSDGTHRYDLHRNCLVKGADMPSFDFAHRSGVLQAGKTVRGGDMERDLRALAVLRTDPRCEQLANWPHQVEQILPRLERAYAVFRSLRFG